MTTSMLDAQWTRDTGQQHIMAGEAVVIEIRALRSRVATTEEAMCLVQEAEALVLAAPAMAKALGGTNGLGHTPSSTPGETRLSCPACAHFEPGHMSHCAVGNALMLAGLA